jgi:hypothetical protein
MLVLVLILQRVILLAYLTSIGVMVESLFNQAVSFFIFGSIVAISGVLVWLRNNNNNFREVLQKIEMFKSNLNDLKKVNDKLIEDNLKLKKNFTDLRLEVDACQDHCAKLRDQQLIIIKRQKLFRDKLIPQKIIIESAKDISKQYEKTFSKIKTQLGEL